MTPRLSLDQPISTHCPPPWLETRGSQMPLQLSSLFLSLQGVGGPWGQISPRAPLHLSNRAGYRSQHFPSGTKFKKFAIKHCEPAGDRAETSKEDRKINLKCPRRVESCVICRTLCTTVNLSCSLGWLGSFSPRVAPVGERPGVKPSSLPLSSDTRRDDASSVAGCEELARAVLL